MDAMERNALIFDIETIADLTPENCDAIAALAQHRDMTPEHYAALCPPLARVVCIAGFDASNGTLAAFVDASLSAHEPPPSISVDDGRTAAAGKLSCVVQRCDGEAQLLERFGNVVEEHLRRPNGQLVTYNGRGFDLPVLVHRSVKHGVTAGRALLTKAVQENRYAPVVHLDLMDAVTFYGASGRWPMAAYAIGYGFKSPKQDMAGAQVGDAVRAGRIIDVVRYCAGDALATAHVYRCFSSDSPASARHSN